MCYRRSRTVAFDGCSSAEAPARPRVCAWLGKHKHRYGQGGYPKLKLLALHETGTRALLGAAFGPMPPKETAYAEQLLPLLDDSMMLLNDRGFVADWGWATPGAAWLDASYWVICLITEGHAPSQAEAVAPLPAWRTAP